LVSMHLLHGLLQGLDLLVQRPDLLTGRLLLVAHLELAELVRGLAEDVIRDVAQADLLAVGGAQVQIIDDHVQPRDWVRAQLPLADACGDPAAPASSPPAAGYGPVWPPPPVQTSERFAQPLRGCWRGQTPAGWPPCARWRRRPAFQVPASRPGSGC